MSSIAQGEVGATEIFHDDLDSSKYGTEQRNKFKRLGPMMTKNAILSLPWIS